MLAFPPCAVGVMAACDILMRMLASSAASVSDSGRWPQMEISPRWKRSIKPAIRSRLGTFHMMDSQVSLSPPVMVLESVEFTECADDTVASLGEILKSLHDGGAELPPVGGVVIVGGDRGRRVAVAGIGLHAPGTGCAESRIV